MYAYTKIWNTRLVMERHESNIFNVTDTIYTDTHSLVEWTRIVTGLLESYSVRVFDEYHEFSIAMYANPWMKFNGH